VSRVPCGRASKAALVGANTVNGPGELSVSARSPATTAATRVERLSTDWANSTMLGRGLDVSAAGGNITPSMMCATPLEAMLSAAITFFKSRRPEPTPTFPSYLVTTKFLPSTVVTTLTISKSVDKTCDGSTWKVRISTN